MNEQAVAIRPERAGEIMEAVIAKGDLAQLTPIDRAKYYRTVCESIGINPLTKPFEYITLNGKLTLYARKDCTDQLRKLYGVSVEENSEKREADLIIVTVKVRDKTGRTDMSKGAVTLKNLAGEALANAIMKAETKAKRRATLSICGLGFLDETEVETISNANTPRLPKKDARDIYKRLESEVDEAADIEDWLLKNEGRLMVLPADWENVLRLRIQERQQTPVEPAETVVWEEPEDGTTPEWQGSKWDTLGPVKQAGILCADASFWKFLEDKFPAYPSKTAEEAASTVRSKLAIESRSELGKNAAATRRWHELVAEYRAWQREPEIIDQVSSRVTPATEEAAPVEHQPPAPQTGAATIQDDKTAAEWDVLLGEAAKEGSAKLRAVWESMPNAHKKTCEQALRRRHQPTAAQADEVARLARGHK